MYQWLDRAPKGRNETGVWWRRHNEYKESDKWRVTSDEKPEVRMQKSEKKGASKDCCG
jgi:hypothetical protein